MTLAEFRRTLGQADPPPVSLALRALWWAARGDRNRAHGSIDDSEDPDAMWVHAHLHRQEGDLSNARYWYARAARPEFIGTIEEEHAAIATALLRR